MYKIIFLNENNEQKTKIANVSYADSFLKRFKGLMRKSNFNGLIFKQRYPDKYSGSIHTCFMKVPIDIIYISSNMIIQEIITLHPWKVYIPKNENIKYIIELPEKSMKLHDIKLGDKIVITDE